MADLGAALSLDPSDLLAYTQVRLIIVSDSVVHEHTGAGYVLMHTIDTV